MSDHVFCVVDPSTKATIHTAACVRCGSKGNVGECPGWLSPAPVVPIAHDKVNHPKHYTSHPSGVEAITVCEWLPFNLGNAIKYCWRVGLKEGEDDDTTLAKAVWYIERERARRKKAGGK